MNHPYILSQLFAVLPSLYLHYMVKETFQVFRPIFCSELQATCIIY